MQTIKMEIAVSLNEMDFWNSHLLIRLCFSQTVEYQTDSMSKPELKEVPQILENFPGRLVTEYFQKYFRKLKHSISGWNNV